MRWIPPRYGCVLLLFVPVAAFGQDAKAKDPRAVSILQQSIVAAGGGVSTSISASGSIASYVGGKETAGTIKVQSLGADKYREETEVEGLKLEMIVSGNRLIFRDADQTRRIRAANMPGYQHSLLPFAKLAAALSAISTGVQYEGLIKTDGAEAHQLRIAYSLPMETLEPDPFRASIVTVLIDSSSFLPLEIRFNLFAEDAPNDAIPAVITFAGWQRQNGFVFPMQISKSLNGTLHSKISFSKVDFNSGLTDALFAIQ